MNKNIYAIILAAGKGRRMGCGKAKCASLLNDKSFVEHIVDTLKGEFVLIVEGNKEEVDFSSLSIDEHVKMYIEDGLSEMDAIKKVAKERGVAKSIIYKEYHIGK